MSLVSIWTGEDTSERGPSCDEQDAKVTVDDDALDMPDTDVPVLLHVAADGPAGLWTVALYLKPDEARTLAASLFAVAAGR